MSKLILEYFCLKWYFVYYNFINLGDNIIHANGQKIFVALPFFLFLLVCQYNIQFNVVLGVKYVFKVLCSCQTRMAVTTVRHPVQIKYGGFTNQPTYILLYIIALCPTAYV